MGSIKDLKKGEIAVIVVPNSKYTSQLPKIAKHFSNSFDATCYVSLNKPFKTLEPSLKKGGVKTDKFLFVDGITKTAMPDAKPTENCLLISSASALTEISIAVNKVLKTGKFDGFIFDSLSTLLVYNKGKVVGKFVHSLVNKIKSHNMTAVFTALKGDTDSELLKEVDMYVDKVIEI